jgi:hypothetical protein
LSQYQLQFHTLRRAYWRIARTFINVLQPSGLVFPLPPGGEALRARAIPHLLVRAHYSASADEMVMIDGP